MLRRDISPMDKIRLLMAYIITQEGIRDDDRKRLIEAAGLSPEDQTALVNLKFLGVTLLRGASKTAPRRKPASKAKEESAASYDLSRYTPRIKPAMEAALTGAASAADFPYVKDRPGPSLGGISPADVSLEARRAVGVPEPSWASRGRQKKEEGATLGPRLVVFMIGGVAYSELKCAYELTKVRARAERARRGAAWCGGTPSGGPAADSPAARLAWRPCARADAPTRGALGLHVDADAVPVRLAAQRPQEARRLWRMIND